MLQLTQDLLERYMDGARSALREMRATYQCDDVLACWHAGKMPQEGRLPSGRSFLLHGVGCLVEDGRARINFDIGARPRVLRFDSWKFLQYARSVMPEPFAFVERESLESVLMQVIDPNHIGLVAGARSAVSYEFPE